VIVARQLYIVHMKRVTASEARRNWFRLLDEVAAGAVVVIERGGRRILLRREADVAAAADLPDYRGLIEAPSVETADRWGWTWSPDAADLAARDDDGDRA
jgi:hypothetical protein